MRPNELPLTCSRLVCYALNLRKTVLVLLDNNLGNPHLAILIELGSVRNSLWRQLPVQTNYWCWSRLPYFDRRLKQIISIALRTVLRFIWSAVRFHAWHRAVIFYVIYRLFVLGCLLFFGLMGSRFGLVIVNCHLSSYHIWVIKSHPVFIFRILVYCYVMIAFDEHSITAGGIWHFWYCFTHFILRMIRIPLHLVN